MTNLTSVIFKEEDHSYWFDGKQLISVTQLMKKHGLATDYTAVPESVLKAKAERGAFIHKEIEEYINDGKEGFSDEFDDFKRLAKENELVPQLSEFVVHNDICAGTIDLVAERNGVCLADYKTCVNLDKHALSWQLSIYAALFKNQIPLAKINALYGFHLTDKSKLIEVDKIPDEEVEHLFECERAGTIYKEPKEELILSPEELTEINNVTFKIAQLQTTLDVYNKTFDKIKSALIKKMAEKGVKSYEDGNLRITYIEPTTRETFDSKRLQAELPSIYQNFKKTTAVKPSIRIMVRETP